MMNTYKMLGQEYANEPYLQSAECRRESALEEVEKTLKVLMCDLGIGIQVGLNKRIQGGYRGGHFKAEEANSARQEIDWHMKRTMI